MTRKHEVCRVSELPPGEQKIIEVSGHSIGLFNVDGMFYAIKNTCPHNQAPLCEGTVTGTTAPTDDVGTYEWIRDGEIVQCPWHKWEFDITTGESVYNPHRMRTRTYETDIETCHSPLGSDREHESNPDVRCGFDLCGEEPPVDTFETDIEQDVLFVFV